ncbi:synaptotagmin-4 [Periophthalmus magnuspinnatus]|uniref:synaptotagmin-4 n=1 Tax=Periophthalmus magnuspinnatus TaxID=409849 RepID=UPI00145B444C|nr:synaptotagmin-4 [Periophthalmus magnuspinnatus]
MAPMVVEGAQIVAVPAGVALVSIFGLVFTLSAFAWICCQRKTSKTQQSPPYKFVHMLKGVDIYPESLTRSKKTAAASSAHKLTKTDVNGNTHSVCPHSPKQLASSPGGTTRPTMHLELEKRDLNGNFTTKPFHHHQQRAELKVRSSPDLELPFPHAGFTQPGVTEHREPTSPSSTTSSQAPTPMLEKAPAEERDGGLGTLHFSLEYQAEKKAFIVHIKEAQGLTPTDEHSLTSDPYIKLTLLPEKKHRVKTRVLRKTLSPAFDETFSFYGLSQARVAQLSLHFVVLSFDRFSRDEVIGESLVPLTGIDLSEGRILMSREIIKKDSKKTSGRGELLLSLCYQSTTNTLSVVVLKARHLPRNDNRPTEPFVKVNMFHGKKRICKKKTHVKKSSPNPVFNELFVFELPSEPELRDISVELLLMDSDPRSPCPVLGRLLLGTTSPGTLGEHWREICEHPRRQIAKWHAMSQD